MPSIFKTLPHVPRDPILSLTLDFQADTREEKIDLSVGVYRDLHRSVPIMRAVKEAERLLIDREQTKSYLPIEGSRASIEPAEALLFGEVLAGQLQDRLFSAQALGGTGALFIAGCLLKEAGVETIALPDPTWPNHKNIFPHAGLSLATYKHGDVESVASLPQGTAVLFHGCCHNPTGLDPSREEWQQLSQIVRDSGLIPVFDIAYQGFGDGLEQDAASIRLFAEAGHEMVVAQSYSKNFGLYGERAGTLFVLSGEGTVPGVVKRSIRSTYSNPPIHSLSIVGTVLRDAELCSLWESELAAMRERLHQIRTKLGEALGRPELLQERGMFSYLGLTKEQVERLKAEFAIYTAGGGRINISGLSDETLPRFIEAMRVIG